MTTGLLEISECVARESRGAAVGIYYVMTYVGFALPFVHALAWRRLGDAITLAAAGALAIASLLIRSFIKAGTPAPFK